MICRVFQKSSAGKKVHISGITRLDSFGTELGSSGLPPLTDTSPSFGNKTKAIAESAYVPCFSNPIDVQRNQGGVFDSSFTNNSIYGVSSNPLDILPRMPLSSGSLYSTTQQGLVQASLATPNLPLPGSCVLDHSILRALNENNGSNLASGFKTGREMISVSHETGLTTEMNVETSSVVSNFDMGRGPFDNQHLESLWNY